LNAPRSAIQRYAFAIASVVVALGCAILTNRYHFRGVEFPLFLFAIALSAWYAGIGPAITALVLSSLAFNYYFTEPYYTLYVTREDLVYYFVFLLFASLLTWFSIVRRRAEEALRKSRDELQIEVVKRTQQANLLNLTSDMIFVRDMDAVITYWNRGAERFYGFTEKEAIGKRHYELLHTVFPMPLDDLVAEVVRTGQWEGEVSHIKANGDKAVVLSRWSLQRDESDRPTAMLAINTDITNRKQGEEQIRALNEELGKKAGELEAINKELEAFAYSTSHDLRAPLRHMVGYTELLQKHAATTFDEKGRRYMATILDAAKKMGTLIDDLLAFSRIGRAEAREANVSLEYLVNDVLSEMPAPDGRKIDWKIRKLPVVYGDGSMLRLALVNLISNAVKFTRTRSRPEIEIGCVEKKNSQAVVFVKDNGVGFDMKYAHKLFGVFQRLHSTEAFEGTGIGLATVQRIIHRHRGRVWAESVVDRGATFYFSVPTQGN
jgi:PAS domain S-box-containing protein